MHRWAKNDTQPSRPAAKVTYVCNLYACQKVKSENDGNQSKIVKPKALLLSKYWIVAAFFYFVKKAYYPNWIVYLGLGYDVVLSSLTFSLVDKNIITSRIVLDLNGYFTKAAFIMVMLSKHPELWVILVCL